MKKSILWFAVLLWGSQIALYGQGGAYGSIVGTVTDTSGAVMAGANVTVTNMETNAATVIHTSAEGSYSVPYLPPATYRVTAEFQGFGKSTIDNIRLAVDQIARADFQLKPGMVTESVTVSASTVEINTENSTIGTVITQRQTEDLPLNGRNFTQLMLLGPGVVNTDGEQSTRPNSGDAFSIAGSRPSSNQYLLDGVTNNDTTYQTPAILPSIDAIEEFKEQTKTYSAAYGTSANQININIKSGTNQLHGTAFDFLRNNSLDSRNFYDANITPLRRNQYGFTLGGSVYIPKVYNGRNQTFFFADYEGLKLRQSSTEFLTVPTLAQDGGIFTTAVVNPATGLDFSNNQVPQSDFSRLANVILPTIPVPNVVSPFGNARVVVASPADDYQMIYRIDENLGSKDRINGHYAQYTWNSIAAGASRSSDEAYQDLTHQVAITWTHTFSANVVNDLRFGFLRAVANKLAAPYNHITPAQIAELDYQNVWPGTLPGVGLPDPQVTGLYTGGGGVNTPWYNNQPTFDISDSTSIVRGTHTISFGAGVREWRLFNNVSTGFTGQYSFQGDWTGVPMADFLLGDFLEVWGTSPGPKSGTTPGAPVDVHYLSLAPYVEDDWKVTRKLTLNLGLRYDWSSVPYEAKNDWSWFDPNIPGGGLCVADKSLVSTFGGGLYAYCGSRTAGSSQKRVFAPRLGFAYSPFGSNKTVVHGGYGIFYDTAEQFEDIGSGNIYPYTVRTAIYSTPGAILNSNNLFPSFTAPLPVNAQELSFYEPQARRRLDPYVQEWSLGFERELTPTTKLEISYIGQKGTHLNMRGETNQPYAYNPADPTPLLAREPYPNFATIVESYWMGNSDYNAANIKVEHRAGDLSMLAAYTWGHSLDTKSAAAAVTGDDSGWAGTLDVRNPNRDYASSSYDARQRFVASFVYTVPVGKGKRFLGGLTGPANVALGGWQVNGIVTFQGGFPFSIGALDLQAINNLQGQRADLVGSPSSGFTKSITEWFNTAAFVQPPLGVIGNTGRNIVRSPGLNNWDASLFKNIPLGERLHLQLRGEFFNVWNHPQFGQPDPNVQDPTFGVISSANAPRIIQVAAKFIF